jgi:tRNA threonylcarbamoyladenosine biosynthesis protein TsaE
MLTYQAATAEETQEIARKLGRLVQRGDVLTLAGDLGAGKTTFTQGLGRGLGVKEPVSSPTFTIIKEYDDGRIPLYHMDIYRLGEGALHEDLGYDDYFYGEGVAVVEWAHFLAELLPEDRIELTIRTREDGGRELSFAGTGPRSEQRLKELKEQCPTSN